MNKYFCYTNNILMTLKLVFEFFFFSTWKFNLAYVTG